MNTFQTKCSLFVTGLASVLFLPVMRAQIVPPSREVIQPTFQPESPNAPGLALTGVTVEYTPGGSTPPHRHGEAFVVAYVLSGTVFSKVDDGPERIFRVGENWTENPHAHHIVSGNASTTEPARVLVLFLAPKSENNFVFLDK